MLKELDENLIKLRTKLEYEWKSVYRKCLALDSGNTSEVSITQFARILQDLKIHLANDEIDKLAEVSEAS